MLSLCMHLASLETEMLRHSGILAETQQPRTTYPRSAVVLDA
jgi:hypothetical protein